MQCFVCCAGVHCVVSSVQVSSRRCPLCRCPLADVLSRCPLCRCTLAGAHCAGVLSQVPTVQVTTVQVPTVQESVVWSEWKVTGSILP